MQQLFHVFIELFRANATDSFSYFITISVKETGFRYSAYIEHSGGLSIRWIIDIQSAKIYLAAILGMTRFDDRPIGPARSAPIGIELNY
jgi:hypothetical protein